MWVLKQASLFQAFLFSFSSSGSKARCALTRGPWSPGTRGNGSGVLRPGERLPPDPWREKQHREPKVINPTCYKKIRTLPERYRKGGISPRFFSLQQTRKTPCQERTILLQLPSPGRILRGTRWEGGGRSPQHRNPAPAQRCGTEREADGTRGSSALPGVRGTAWKNPGRTPEPAGIFLPAEGGRGLE